MNPHPAYASHSSLETQSSKEDLQQLWFRPGWSPQWSLPSCRFHLPYLCYCWCPRHFQRDFDLTQTYLQSISLNVILFVIFLVIITRIQLLKNRWNWKFSLLNFHFRFQNWFQHPQKPLLYVDCEISTTDICDSNNSSNSLAKLWVKLIKKDWKKSKSYHI